MFTDMVGYTLRTQTDEKGTLRLLEEQEGLVAPLVVTHHGRTVKSTGDGYLVEFPSALEAVECAVAIQERLRARNQERREDAAIDLRIGIHLGDVEERGSDIFGDAVNIASRVQPIAEPGGVVVSQQVFDQVRNKIDLRLEKLEPKSLKGIRFPMEIYRVTPPGTPTSDTSPAPETERRLAVLPFTNISPDPKDAYISDGLTEEVISVLSQLGELRVIARTSTDTYRTSPKPIPQVGAELGVSWVMEGSVRKAGTRLRISAQLIDVKTQAHLWASNYDRELDDVFAVQSEIARRVADALQIRLLAKEEARLDRRHTPRADSYLEYLQGRSAMRGIGETDLRRARTHFERALELDEKNAAAHAGLAELLPLLGGLYHYATRAEWWSEARRHAAAALALDPDLAEAHNAQALVLADEYEWKAAEEEFRRAIALNPSFAGGHLWYGGLLGEMGRPDEALQEYALAMALDPLNAIALAQEVELRIFLDRMDTVEERLEQLGRIENRGILYHDRRASFALARDDKEKFRASMDEIETLLPGRPEMRVARARLAVWDGDRERALELLHSVESLTEPMRPDAAIAHGYAMLGDLDACFHWLDICRQERRLSLYPLRYSPKLAHLRADPRYAALLRDVNLTR